MPQSGQREPSLDAWIERPPLDLSTGIVDFARSRFMRTDGKILRLTTREAEALAYLADRPNGAVARDALLEQVWGHSSLSLSRAVDTTMARLRRKLELDPSAPVVLQTVHGHGYRLQLKVATPIARPLEPDDPGPARLLVLGSRTLDLAAGHVQHGETRLALSARERVMLEVLLRARRAAVDGDRLARQMGVSGGRAALRNAVHRLRQKLEDDPSAPRFLLSIHGGAYRLDATLDEREVGRDRHIEALASLTDHLGLVHGLRDGVVYRREGELLVQVAAFGPKRAADGSVVAPLRQRFGQGIVGAAALAGEPLLVADTRVDERYMVDLIPARSELAVPVMLAPDVVGVIDSEASEAGFFQPMHVNLFESLAAIAAPAFPRPRGPSHG